MIDAIFADCFGRWGGRFNLIVPCENGQIRPAYIPWLKAYDADVLYSYVDLSENAVERLHEQFYPSALIRHDFHNHPERDKHAFRPHIPFVPLSSLSTSLLASRGTIFNEPQPVSLLDFYGRNPPPQFLQENFGCYRESLAPWPIPANLSEYIRAVALVEKEVADNPTLVPRPPSDNVTDYQVILQRLAEQRDLSGLAQLSASMCPRLQLHDQRWANRVNIIVGDSFADRLTFWNARSHLAVYLDSSLVTLKMSKADIDDDATLAAIVAIIKNRIHVSYSGQSNSYITVRSASHNQQELDDIVARFHQVDSWNIYSSERIGSIDDCCPEQQALATAMDHVEGRGMFQVSDWHETTFSETSFRPPLIWPRHIRDASIVPDSVTAGAWALDLDIERTLDYSPFENVRHRWRLPRRLRATGAFSGTYQLAGFGSTLSFPRVTDHGLLTLFGQREGRLPEINAPVDDETVFRVALCAPRDWLPFAQGQGPYQNSLVFSIRPSDKGRYLTALTHLSGGINAARAIFLNKFWKQQFESMGASPSAGEDRLPDLVLRLQRRLRAGTIAAQDDWQRIARVVLTEAREVRLAQRYIRFDRLERQFEEFCDAFWSARQPGSPRQAWDADEKRSLGESVRYLCQREILHQGHEWLCRRCNNSNWVSIDALRRSMTCEVCGADEAAPVASPWHFRLNSFVLDGLRAHGMLAYLWCLARLSDQAQACFFFLEPHEIFFTTASADARKPDAEIDLIVVVDGVVRLCEVKTSNQNIQIEKLADMARRIRPDIATLAIMEARSAGTDRRLEELRQLLDGSGIDAEVMTIQEDDIDDGPFLPNGRSQMIRFG